MPQMASVLIKPTADWLTGAVEASRAAQASPPSPAVPGRLLTPGNSYSRRGPQRDTWGFVILPRNYFSLAFSFCYVFGLLLRPKVDVRFSQLLLSQAGTSSQAVSALACGAWQAKHLEQSRCGLGQCRP